MKIVLIICGLLLFGTITFVLGVGYGSAQQPAVSRVESISQTRIDVYNVYMLKNCLKELQAIKGGE